MKTYRLPLIAVIFLLLALPTYGQDDLCPERKSPRIVARVCEATPVVIRRDGSDHGVQEGYVQPYMYDGNLGLFIDIASDEPHFEEIEEITAKLSEEWFTFEARRVETRNQDGRVLERIEVKIHPGAFQILRSGTRVTFVYGGVVFRLPIAPVHLQYLTSL